ncbi:recombinase family protein [Chloroflexota bacterium]
MKRAAIYTRVSSEEQVDGYSLNDQELEVRQTCEFRDWEVVRVYSDTGLSEQVVMRPGFQTMIADAKAGQFDVIAVHELNRFSRSLFDTLSYLGQLDRHDVSFISVAGELDLTTPIGKMMLSILGAFVEWNINSLVVDTQEDLTAAVLPGEWQAALNVLVESLQHQANGTATAADDDLLNLVASMCRATA